MPGNGDIDHQPMGPLVRVDLNADAAKFLIDRLAELGHFFRADVARVGIELRHHAFDGGLQQFATVDVLDVVPLHLLEGVDEHLHQRVVIVLRRSVLLFRILSAGDRGRQNRRENQHHRQPDAFSAG